MPRFAANLTMLYADLPFLDRFEAAAADGFEAVEYLFPYPYRPDELVARLRDAGLKQVLHNLPAGDWAAGERGIGCLPDRTAEFAEGVDRAIEYATALGCPRVNCLAGLAPAGVAPERLRETFVENLSLAAAKLGAAGIELVIEMINTRDVPGFYLNHTRQAREILEAVGSPNLRIQYDFYHMQIMEGDLAPTFQANLPYIGHVQVADTPGRNEPGTGEINYPFLFAHLDRLGYEGWVGCEYNPRGTTSEGLGWVKPYLANAGAVATNQQDLGGQQR